MENCTQCTCHMEHRWSCAVSSSQSEVSSVEDKGLTAQHTVAAALLPVHRQPEFSRNIIWQNVTISTEKLTQKNHKFSSE